MAKPVAKSFQATLERDGTPLKWVIVRIPFDAAKIWGKRGQIRVKGDINGFAFGTSLFPTGDGRHVLLVNKKMQRGGKAVLGSVARFRLEPDTEERVVTVPAELERLLAEDRAFRRWFDQLNHSMRYWIGKWIADVKSAEARERRAEQMAERLLSTMEAERDLPPILRVAFARDARAEEGWSKMSPTQRRSHLLGIFYYREPAARARRVAKVVQEAHKFAERGRGRTREL
ncbi:MAG: YdeI/OmpD-associated family protein [Acidobacteriia bacterium]|nr:YdeI/OmpD-associated family protein [Terriglobia bacterium]